MEAICRRLDASLANCARLENELRLLVPPTTPEVSFRRRAGRRNHNQVRIGPAATSDNPIDLTREEHDAMPSPIIYVNKHEPDAGERSPSYMPSHGLDAPNWNHFHSSDAGEEDESPRYDSPA